MALDYADLSGGVLSSGLAAAGSARIGFHGDCHCTETLKTFWLTRNRDRDRRDEMHVSKLQREALTLDAWASRPLGDTSDVDDWID
ncbi:MAG: hypothetical protein LC749_17265 [Actinobacteria bacterium]|nr:hypothetical protein [Actinomycetota bacterium]